MAAKLFFCLLCDDVRVESTGKHMIIGLFDRFRVVDFTQPLPPFRVFGKIGLDRAGPHAVKIRVSSREGDFSVQLDGSVEARDVSDVTDLYESIFSVTLGGLQVPRDGRYDVGITVDGVDIGGATFIAETVRPPSSSSPRLELGPQPPRLVAELPHHADGAFDARPDRRLGRQHTPRRLVHGPRRREHAVEGVLHPRPLLRQPRRHLGRRQQPGDRPA